MAIRRTPFEEMERMMNEMRHAMFGDGPETAGDSGSRYDTHVSVEAGDDGYLVVADLPGFETEEIDLRFDDGVLVTDAEHETEEEMDVGIGRLATTRNRRTFERVRLPGTVLVDDITASYTNGVLEVHVPTEESVDDSGTVIDIE
ncbi:Hsp20/alpha crystallin family protein [Natronomonas marina]|jgi:HSP20 family protein|uniref:Hsp20/alpha crystallin family protein n=1 Tax=Natronomonas marina TaxID=2961939 RepID=UPI0020C9A516|nr:Hsp20/alpha crystallin family protein [Natronomonas marina]